MIIIHHYCDDCYLGNTGVSCYLGIEDVPIQSPKGVPFSQQIEGLLFLNPRFDQPNHEELRKKKRMNLVPGNAVRPPTGMVKWRDPLLNGCWVKWPPTGGSSWVTAAESPVYKGFSLQNIWFEHFSTRTSQISASPQVLF